MRVPIVLCAAFVAGCAQTFRPIVDMKAVDEAKYEQDLAECRAYADEVSPLEEAGAGALFGVLVGAALGAVLGATGDGLSAGAGAVAGAALGGTTGVVAGGAGGAQAQADVIKACLSGRGYRVLR